MCCFLDSASQLRQSQFNRFLGHVPGCPPCPHPPCRSTGCLQVCCGRNCGLLLGTAQGRRHRKKLDLRLVHNLNREATQQVGGLAAVAQMQLLDGEPGCSLGTLLYSTVTQRIIAPMQNAPSLQAAGLADRDLLDVRYEGEVEHVLPYFIAVDENTRSLVLAIRGGVGVVRLGRPGELGRRLGVVTGGSAGLPACPPGPLLCNPTLLYSHNCATLLQAP